MAIARNAQKHLTNDAFDLYNNAMIAADMIADLKDRQLIYGILEAASEATLYNVNPRLMLMRHAHNFKHIPLNMDFKNW